MPPKMKDIAAAVGVSVVTVSKVLNGNKSISEHTSKRVLACAERLGYLPNLAAKELVTGHSRIVGLIVPELMHSFFSEVAASLLETLRPHGYGLIISSSRDDSALEREEVRQMSARNVDALVIASCEADSPVLCRTAKERPVILLDRKIDGVASGAFVGTDDVMAGEIATGHLIAGGYKRIAYIGGSNLSSSVDRETGYRNALKKARIRFIKSLVVTLPQNEEASHRYAAAAMRKLLQNAQRPDAVFCYNDTTAYGVVHSALEAGLRVPQDLGVVGCGHLRLNEFMRVPLTSIDQDTARLGQESARAALKMIEGQQSNSFGKKLEVIVPSRLIQGESTRKLPLAVTK
jgi:LacI family transcriptional regulator